MKLKETVLDDFKISGITQKAIDEKGVHTPLLINTRIYDTDLELLFEVQSSSDEPHKVVDLQGKFKQVSRGYTSVLRFLKFTDWLDGEELTPEYLKEIFDVCDVTVHCDCPSFYYQGMAQDNALNGNSRWDFYGKKGDHIWTLRHSREGGTTGRALCKHLDTVKKWVFEKENLKKLSNEIAKVYKKKTESRKFKKSYLLIEDYKTYKRFIEKYDDEKSFKKLKNAWYEVDSKELDIADKLSLTVKQFLGNLI